MTQSDETPVSDLPDRRELLPIHGIPGIWRFAVRTPTLPPATHTNVYIVGEGQVVVVDPASPYPEERAALAEALSQRREKLAAIFLTHQHVDHVSGAEVLSRATGAPIWAHAETASRLRGRITVDSAGLGDWRQDAPGVRRRITLADLPAPYETSSFGNAPRIVPRPEGAMPKAPPGFTVT